MKTPDEIKKGLECCLAGPCPGAECPYYEKELFRCGYFKSKDALAYIQQLERERDAAVEDMATVIYNGAEIVCQFCKHKDEHKCAQICGFAFKGFEWRGVKED